MTHLRRGACAAAAAACVALMAAAAGGAAATVDGSSGAPAVTAAGEHGAALMAGRDHDATHAVDGDDGWIALAGDAVDYAPSGVPDFDMRQSGWQTEAPTSSSWTRDGPAALADALWWLDSQLEPGDVAPPTVSDGFALVEAYGAWDDHDARNVRPLIGDITATAGTDGPRRMLAQGTCFEDLQRAADEVASRSIGIELDAAVVDLPSLDQLSEAVGAGRATVLLLGIWQHHDAVGWQRVGGHYTSLDAVNGDSGQIRLSDPFRDVATPTGDVTAHNDAALVSHDAWSVSPSLRPGPVLKVEEYLTDAAFENLFVGNHAGLNRRRCADPDLPWLAGARLEIHVDAALSMSLEPAAVPSPGTATASASPSPGTPPSGTVTSDPGGPTAAATSTPTSSATASTSPAPTSSATSSATAPVAPSHTSLPPPTASATSTPVAPTLGASPSPEASPSHVAGTATAGGTATPVASPEPASTDPPAVRPVYLPMSLCSRRSR